MRGFSLVELSIVLVILGLLTGGILSGQSLIRASELRSVSTDLSRHMTAVQTFRDRYMSYPGDMNNATQFWGKNNAACSSQPGTASATGTCNGNGDGNVALSSSVPGGGSQESFQLWHQLALAGLIEGTYTGLAGPDGYGHAVFQSNVPVARINNAGWGVRHVSSPDPTYHFQTGKTGNVFTVGALSGIISFPQSSFLKPEEAWNIDTKADDGLAARGKVVSTYWTGTCTTATSATQLDAEYALTSSAINCGLWIYW